MYLTKMSKAYLLPIVLVITRSDTRKAVASSNKIDKLVPGKINLNPFLTHGPNHHYQLGKSTVTSRGVRSYFQFFSHFSMNFL